MNSFIRILLILLFAAAVVRGAAPGPRPARTIDYESFNVISKRNIFDPERSRRSSSRPPPREDDQPPPVRTESFGLVGTMSYHGNQLAFFEGTSSDYRKTVALQGTIAGHTVTEITPAHVMLEAEGQKKELPVGMQLTKQGDKPWESGGLFESSSSRRSESSSNGDRSRRSEDSNDRSRRSDNSNDRSRRSNESQNDRSRRPENNGSSRPTRPTETSSDRSTKPTEPSTAPEDPDILKRLLEKREKE